MADEPKMSVMPAHFAAGICLDPADFIEECHSDDSLGMSTPELNAQCQQIVDAIVGPEPRAPREDENKTLARITKFFLTVEEEIADEMDTAPKVEESLAKEGEKPVEQKNKSEKKAKSGEDVPARVASEPSEADQSAVVASLGAVVPMSAGAFFVYGISPSDFKTVSEERKISSLSAKSADVLENRIDGNSGCMDQGAAILFSVREVAFVSETAERNFADPYRDFLFLFSVAPKIENSGSPKPDSPSGIKDRDSQTASALAGMTQSFLEMAYRVGILGEPSVPLDSGRKKKTEESAPSFFLHGAGLEPLDPQVVFVGYPIVLPRMQGAGVAVMMVSEGRSHAGVERKSEGQPSKDSKQGNGQDSGQENKQGRGSKQNNPSQNFIA